MLFPLFYMCKFLQGSKWKFQELTDEKRKLITSDCTWWFLLFCFCTIKKIYIFHILHIKRAWEMLRPPDLPSGHNIRLLFMTEWISAFGLPALFFQRLFNHWYKMVPTSSHWTSQKWPSMQTGWENWYGQWESRMDTRSQSMAQP